MEEYHQYCGGCSVLWDGYHQYSGGRAVGSISRLGGLLRRNNRFKGFLPYQISYLGELLGGLKPPSPPASDGPGGMTTVLWRMFSNVEGYHLLKLC